MDLRKIDQLVAEKVMGWKLTPYGWDVPENKYNLGFEWNLPHFSSSIENAWQVAEKFKYYKVEKDRDSYYCELLCNDGFVYIEAETAPLAICLAALKAYEIDIEV